MRIVVFGIGRFYNNRKDELERYGDEIIAFIDNRANEVNTFEKKSVFLPENILELRYDCILLMSADYKRMKTQLLNLGVEGNKIYDWKKYRCERRSGELKIYPYQNYYECSVKKRVLIVSEILNYNGATLAALYVAKTLQKLKYDVTLAASGVNTKFLSEVEAQKVRVIIAPGIPYISNAELDWIRLYDVIIVNVFQMINIAYMAGLYKPVLWWIHEPSNRFEELYKETIECFPYENENIGDRKIYICSVSNIAKANFEVYHPGMVNEILPYGIPDEIININNYKNEVVFAIIGSVMEIKGQLSFVNAISLLPYDLKRKSTYKIIGSLRIGTDYYNRVKDLSKNVSQIQFIGELNRRELNELFSEIDVVVCASLEETMSLTITEGMMHGKVCITTDATGIADYITDGVNGFVCAAGDALSLSKKMQYVIEHYDEMDKVREAARKTYEEHFSLEKFGDRLEKAILNAENYYYNS